MYPLGGAVVHPVGPLLLQYTMNGWPVDAGRPWPQEEIITAAERGPRKSALVPDAIQMIHGEVQ